MENETKPIENQSDMFKAMVERVKALEAENEQLRMEQREFLNNWSTTPSQPKNLEKPKFILTENGIRPV